MTISAARVIAVGLLLLAALLLAVSVGPAGAQTPPNEEVGLVRLSIGGEGCESYETPERTAESPPQLVFSGLERCIRADSSDEFTVAAPHIVWQSDFEIQLTIESAETGTIGFDAECSEVSAAYSLTGTRRVTPSGDEISPLAVTIYGCGGVGIGTVSAVLKDGAAAILYSEGYPVYFLDEPAVTGESSFIPPAPTVRLSLSPAALRPGGHAKLTYNVSGLTSTYSGLFSISSANRSVVGFSIGCTVANTLSPRWSGRSSYSGTIAVYGCARGTVSLNWSVHQYIQGASKSGIVWAQDEPLSVTVSGPTVPLAPAPGNLRAASTSRTSITLSWNSVDGVSFYRVRYSIRRGVTAEKYTSSTSYLATGLSCGTSYAFTVDGHGRAYGNYQFNWGYARQVTGRTSSCGTSPPPRPAPTPVPTPTPTPRPNPTITISAGQSKAVEGDTLSFTLTASSAPTSKLTVNLSVTGGEAFFSGTRSLSVDIAANTTSVDLSLATTDDAVDEPDGIIKVTINSGSGYIVGRNSSDTVDVADNDPPAVSIARATGQADKVQEGSTLEFTLSATSAPTDAEGLDVTVNIQGGSKFLVNPTTTTTGNIGQGRTTGTLRLATEDDDKFESEERITLTVIAVGTTDYTVGSPSVAAVTVTSEDLQLPLRPTKNGEPKSGADGITLKWKPIDGVVKYRVNYGLFTTKTRIEFTTVETTRTSLEITLTCNNDYIFRVSAYGDGEEYRAVWGPNLELRVDSQLCKLDTPVVDVVPLPLLKALLRWRNIPDAASYTLQGRVVKVRTNEEAGWSTPGDGCCPWLEPEPGVQNGIVTSDKPNVTATILLDEILTKQEAYEFRVTAVPQANSTTRQASEGAIVVLVDNPIIQAHGYTTKTIGGQIDLEWNPIAGVTSYQVRARVLRTTDGKDHTQIGWRQDDSSVLPSYQGQNYENLSSSLSAYSITEYILSNEIYGVQLNYHLGGKKFYSARDVFVWTSNGFPQGRVATYPYFGHYADRIYRYRICTDTFPAAVADKWAQIIEHALENWETSTNGLVTVTRVSGQCRSLSEAQINSNRHGQDGEVRILGRPRAVLEMSTSIYKGCVWNPPGCVVSPGYDGEYRASKVIGYAEILLNAERWKNYDSDKLVMPDAVSFNTCFKNGTPDKMDNTPREDKFYAYAIIVHEGGHALGLSGAELDETARKIINDWLPEVNAAIRAVQIPVPSFRPLDLLTQLLGQDQIQIPEVIEMEYEASHPTVSSSVMNYDYEIPGFDHEPDCSPHPMDIMAVYALYQKIAFEEPHNANP